MEGKEWGRYRGGCSLRLMCVFSALGLKGDDDDDDDDDDDAAL